jgi:hypothetical protein
MASSSAAAGGSENTWSIGCPPGLSDVDGDCSATGAAGCCTRTTGMLFPSGMPANAIAWLPARLISTVGMITASRPAECGTRRMIA